MQSKAYLAAANSSGVSGSGDLPVLAGTVWDRLYTEQQMRQMHAKGALAERERVLRIIEAAMPDGRSVNWSIYDGARHTVLTALEEAIRGED